MCITVCNHKAIQPCRICCFNRIIRYIQRILTVRFDRNPVSIIIHNHCLFCFSFCKELCFRNLRRIQHLKCKCNCIELCTFRLIAAICMNNFQAIRRCGFTNIKYNPVWCFIAPFCRIISVKCIHCFFTCNCFVGLHTENICILWQQNRFERNRRIKLQLIHADTLCPSGCIGSADIDFENTSAVASQIVCCNIVDIISRACDQFPIGIIFKQLSAFLKCFCKQIVHWNFLFVQYIELIVCSIDLSCRCFTSSACMYHFELCQFTCFTDVKSNPFIVAINTPFAGILTCNIAVKQFFRSLCTT